jgi:hypothetical protein
MVYIWFGRQMRVVVKMGREQGIKIFVRTEPIWKLVPSFAAAKVYFSAP